MFHIKYLLIPLFFVSLAYGAEVQKDGTIIESIQAPFYGLNTTDPSFRLNPKFSPYMRNVFIDQGRIEGINGFVILGSSIALTKVTGIFPFIRETGQATYLVTDSSLTLETSDFVTWTFVSSGANTGALLKWMQVRNKMWGFNGVDFVKVWDGTTLTILDGDPISIPNVPKFKYGEYWQERVWGLNTTAGVSNLNFSSLSSTDATIINPDDYRAWPVTNQLTVGQGDGEFGTSLWVKDGQLQVGKNRSKYTIYGTGASSYFARKDESRAVGVVSDESVVNLDDATYSLGQDGIYKDNQRISDLIEDDVQNISKGNINVISNIWDTQSDFAKGQFAFGSTATLSGILTVSAFPFLANISTHVSAATLPINSSYTLTMASPFGVITPTNTIPANFQGQFYTDILPFKVWVNCDCVPAQSSDLFDVTVEVKNIRSGQAVAYSHQKTVQKSGGFSQLPLADNATSYGPVVSAKDIADGMLAIKITASVGASDPSDKILMFPATGTSFSNIYLVAGTTASFISNIVTMTMVTAWGNFDSARDTKGGSINYFIRSSTSIVNIATKTWTSITPGATIGEPTINKFIQWTTTMNGISLITPPEIDNVEIDHVEGVGSFDRAFAIEWKNRYWLATTTAIGTNLTLLYIKSRITNENPNAWMPIDGINIGCLAKNESTLYAGSVSTGIIYRLDYGTSFNGSPINFIYDSPDMPLGDNFYSKDLLSYRIDAMKDTDLTLGVKSSIDMGDYSTRNISLSGSGRALNIIKGVVAPVKTLRVRLTHGMLDKQFGVNEFAVRYKMSNVEEPKP